MRLPNLSVSDSVIKTIQELNADRYKLDQQISSGQKIALPEDDGMRMGRVIELETHKGQITQYQRNASYAKEFLDAGYLNLDHLRDLNQRAQEIARSAGSSLNGPAMETYGHEIDQLIEEALNRVNSTHRKQSLFGGTKLKPEFNHTKTLVEKKDKKLFAFNEVGKLGTDGKRRLDSNEQVILAINGREYVFKAKVNGLDLDEAKKRLRDLINKDTKYLSNSPSYETDQYIASVRGSASSSTFRNNKAVLSAEITSHGEISVLGSPGENFSASSTYITKWDPNNYYPNQLQAKLDSETASRYPGSSFESLSSGEKQLVQDAVYKSDWSRSLTVSSSTINSESDLSFEMPNNWKRLTIYAQGDVVERNGRLWESIGSENVNHDPSASGADYWREVGSNYNKKREDWKLEVTGKSNRLYFTSPDGTLFPDRTSATNYSRNILISTKIKDYQLSTNPAQALATDLSNAVKQVSIPVNQFSVSGSENEGAVFFDPETLKYSLKTAATGGSIISGAFIKDNGQVFRANQRVNANDVILDEGRYFLVQKPNSVDSANLPYLVEKLPPSGDIISYSGQIIKSTDSPTPALNAGQYLEVINADPAKPSQFYLSNSNTSLTAVELNGLSSSTPTVPSSLSKVSYDPSLTNVSLNAGQYLFDSTNGKYFLVKSNSSFSLTDTSSDPFSGVNKVEMLERTDGNVFLLGSNLPVEGKEKIYYEDRDLALNAGDYVTYQPPAINNNDTFVLPPVEYYVALQDINKHPSWVEGNPVLSGEYAIKDGKLYFANTALKSTENTAANHTINWSVATTWQEGFAVKAGDSVFKNGNHYTAKTDITPTNNTELNFSTNWSAQTIPDYSIKEGVFYSKVGSSTTLPGPTTANQGEDWSPNLTYDFGQIVFHEGSYYQCQVNSFDNSSDAPNISGVPTIITPSDQFIYNATNQKVANDKWIKVDKSLDHVLKFSVDNTDKPLVSIQPSGLSGNDAKAEAILDSDGEVVGLKVLEPGRYFFGVSNAGYVPPDFEKVKVLLSNGQEMEADILWEQNPVDPGAYRVAGFDISVGVPLNTAKSSAAIGDSYSFATGNKTFLDHRNENGDVLSVTYTGSDSNSSYYIGSESKMSAFLQAKNNGTSELSEVVNDLVSLRDSLINSTPSHYSQEIEDNEKKLLLQEDKLIDKMGELSAKLSRMDTVKSHDEDYFMQLDQRISSDVDIDLSEAIMRLTQLSTAYQASLQVGSQLLNTSLLNYL